MAKSKLLKRSIFLIFGIISIILVLSPLFSGNIFAATIDELKQKITDRNNTIAALEKEIEGYQKQLDETGKQKATLKTTITTLEQTRKKLETSIKVTENKISGINLEIKELEIEIKSKESNIEKSYIALAANFRLISEQESQSFIENLLSQKVLSDVWSDLENMAQLQSAIKNNADELKNLTESLKESKDKSLVLKDSLLNQKKNLSDQKLVVVYNKNEKDKVLAETKNKEAEFQKILAEKKKQKDLFEKELFDYESQLKIAIDPKSFPSSGHSILSWPLDNVFITQLFGQTADSKRLYVSGSHNGIDFRASIGTEVKAALNGVVTAVGNTDAVPGCYSYGKWVLIKHDNGLSTIYSHFSVISVAQGQNVKTGERIGYSGNTGYATGPHLHFGVFATQGVRVTTYDTSIHCKGAVIPMADIKAYLDPMVYLPTY
ncbi:MAG: peptidoglycan DD-metalloendopeptidase family protein [Candidatus Paceibacterota bacterium]